jgi:hypothetical protein
VISITRNTKHLFSVNDFDALTTVRLTQRFLVVVKVVPAVEVCELHASRLE